MNRRHFLQASSLAATGLFTTNLFGSRARVFGANDKINHACIGVGGMGYGDMSNFLSHGRTQVVAICDVDRNRLSKAAEKIPGVRCYTDWRELLIKEGDRIDSVNVTVPDHMHTLISVTAMKAGKHVYCQKPLCHDVAECRLMSDVARQTGVVTQLGTQHASGAGDLQGVQWLKAGIVGEVKKLYLCSNRTGAEKYRLLGPRPEQGQPAPDTLAWDLWIGTAPDRPYAPDIYHPTCWRAWQDFGTGWSGDIGCHIFDAAWKGLELQAPISVKAEVQESWKTSPARRGDTWPQGQHITWVFPGNKASGGKSFTAEWFDGAFYPPADAQALAKLAGFEKYPEENLLVIGSEGAMFLPHTGGPILVPKEKYQAVQRPKVERRNHYHHFIDGCLGIVKNESFFERTGPMTEAILLGTVAIRVPDTELQWDAQQMRITNSDEANRYLKRTYRKGWEIA